MNPATQAIACSASTSMLVVTLQPPTPSRRTRARGRRTELAANRAGSPACGARRARTRMTRHPSLSHRPTGALPEAQARHQPHGLSGDPPGHLALAALAIAKDDRHLHHAKARLGGTVGELDLEGVPLGANPVEVDRLEHLAAKALEAARQVAHAHAQHEPRVQRAALADEPAQEAPVADAATGNVARAERQVCAVVHRAQEAREIRRIV